jgi:NTE family protein
MPDSAETAPEPRRVLVLQGGGALGAYQAGVYEALSAGGVRPQWVAGISIGAINAALIAGNPPELRVPRLKTFWERVSSGFLLPCVAPTEGGRTLFGEVSASWAAAFGVPGMFAPRPFPPVLGVELRPGALSFYDTRPLRETLEELVDFDRINSGEVRLSVGAVNIRTGNFAYFDNANETIGPEHIMASGALPPGLPPVEIKGEWYWDGGIVSNTPLEYVLESDLQDDLLIHQVDLFNARGTVPKSLWEAVEREKEIRFSSRTRHNTNANLRIQELKAALRNLIASLPAPLSEGPEVKMLGEFSRERSVAVVQLIYRSKPHESGSKDFEFSRTAMREHWMSGVMDARRALRREPRYVTACRSGGAASFDPAREEAAGLPEPKSHSAPV